MNLFRIFLSREFKIFLAQPNKFMANLLFFIISTSIFSLFFKVDASDQKFLLLKQFWFISIFSSIFTLTNFIDDDFNDGNLEQLIAGDVNLEIYLLVKILFLWLVNNLPILIIILVISFFKNFDKIFTSYLIINFVLTSILLYFIAAFCSSISPLSNSSSLIAVIILPLFIPIILISCADLENISSMLSNIKILFSLIFFIVPLSIFSSATIIKIANE